ncbi:hypothetical protein ACFQ3Z_09995 [Streptomyces nogalater]
MRPLWWGSPEDRALRDCEDAFLLGDSLLVAPVLEPGAGRAVRLPRGRWYDTVTEEAYEGRGSWSTRRCPGCRCSRAGCGAARAGRRRRAGAGGVGARARADRRRSGGAGRGRRVGGAGDRALCRPRPGRTGGGHPGAGGRRGRAALPGACARAGLNRAAHT